MEARFKTNLDLAQRFVSELQARKCVAGDYQRGDLVEFHVDHGYSPDIPARRAAFTLEVVSRTHRPSDGYTLIELHMHRGDTRSIREWEQWFKRHVLNRE